MTVQELLNFLLTKPLDMIVVYQTSEETYSPAPVVKSQNFDMSYWDNYDLKSLPKGTKYIEL